MIGTAGRILTGKEVLRDGEAKSTGEVGSDVLARAHFTMGWLRGHYDSLRHDYLDALQTIARLEATITALRDELPS